MRPDPVRVIVLVAIITIGALVVSPGTLSDVSSRSASPLSARPSTSTSVSASIGAGAAEGLTSVSPSHAGAQTGVPIATPETLTPSPGTPPAPSVAPIQKPIRVTKPLIWFCPPLPATAIPIRLVGRTLCGAGFHSREVVTLRLTSARGLFWWTAIAASNGDLMSALPPEICFDLPGTIRAFGNRGSISNVLPLLAVGCLTA